MNVAATPSRPAQIDEVEWALRVDLAAAYRIFARMGWMELIYNHITVRVPGPEKHFLINPFGLMYDEVTASNLVRIDVKGNIVGHSDWPVNPAGFTVHAAIHDNIDGAHCVMHTHTTSGMAVACSQGGLSMSNFYSAQLFDKVAYHDFEGITVHAEEGPRLIANIGRRPAVILRNHGLLAWGGTIAQAFSVLWTLQRACDVQVASMTLGPVIEIPLAVQQKCTADALQFNPKFGAGEDVFSAMKRMIDRVDPSYRM